MNEESREELLSAYLDDELSAAERARVEAWLAEDAEYRRLYDELASLRTDLQSLPRHALREDLGPAVLRRAEQQVLDGKPSGSKVELAPPSSSAGQWWSRRSGRMFLWPVVAVAAALMVALFNTQQDPREVARDDADFKDATLENGRMKSADESGYAAASESDALAKSTASGATVGEVPDLRPTAMPQEPADTPAEPQSAANAPVTNRSVPRYFEKSQPRDKAIMRGAAPAATLKLQGNVTQRDFDLGATVETNIKRALEHRALVNLIQCDVTPAFLNENPLEQVLSGNKIAYERYAIPQADTKTNRAIQSQSELDSDDNLGYACEATPEQVELIVNDLVKEQNRRRVSNLVIGLQEPREEAGAKADAKVAAEKLQLLEDRQAQQPVTIYLRKQAAGQQAEPAQQSSPPAAPAP